MRFTLVLDQALERLKAYEEAREAMRGQQVAASSAALRSPVTGVVWSLATYRLRRYLLNGAMTSHAPCSETIVFEHSEKGAGEAGIL